MLGDLMKKVSDVADKVGLGDVVDKAVDGAENLIQKATGMDVDLNNKEEVATETPTEEVPAE